MNYCDRSHVPIGMDTQRGMDTKSATAPAASAGNLGLGLRFAGAALLAATAAIHLDLYLTGYKTLPTIGILFLLQVIAAFLLAAAVAATGNRLVAALGAGFLIATLGGYLLSLWVGLFGFKEVRTTAGVIAAIIEIAGFAVLAWFTALPAASGRSGLPASVDQLLGRLPGGMRGTVGAIALVSAVALVVVGVSVGTAGGSSSATQASAGSVLKTTTIKGVTVLTNSKGFTLYLFAPDSPTKSVCNGSCAGYWPPVKAPVSATGIKGTITTITRADGSKQAAYNGHPLYTYIGDSKPGQASGNNVTLNGGLWKEIVVSG
jgi:predicted lipoprotein with Yx(FWY)xxD motif